MTTRSRPVGERVRQQRQSRRWTLDQLAEAAGVSRRALVNVEQGAVTIEAGDQSVTLNVGDGVAFSGDVAHGHANPHGRPARFVLSVFKPGVGAGAARREAVDG